MILLVYTLNQRVRWILCDINWDKVLGKDLFWQGVQFLCADMSGKIWSIFIVHYRNNKVYAMKIIWLSLPRTRQPIFVKLFDHFGYDWD